MFTRGFRKPFFALSAVLAAGCLYAGVVLALTVASTWAEQDLHAFPFKDEDWLRYLLPSWFATQPRPRLMLTGPSTVRENLRYERFEERFPDHAIYQGGLSGGTLADVNASLEYVERVYGAGALPDFIVLGTSPRFIANIPDDRPFSLGLNRYSPHFHARPEASGIALIPKRPLEGALASIRFLASKQPERFRTGLLAIFNYALSRAPAVIPGAADATTLESQLDRLLRNPLSAHVVRRIGVPRILDHTFSELLKWRISPYKYSLNPPLQYSPGPSPRMLQGWWGAVYAWDPVRDERAARARLKRFVDFAKAHRIQVVIVNLPERDVSRALYDEAKYRAYLDLVRSSAPGVSFLDLKDFLRTDEFYDREHTLPAGSLRLTDEVIRHVKAAMPEPGASRSEPGPGPSGGKFREAAHR